MSRLFLVAALLLQGATPERNEALLEAARTGNRPQVTAALDGGADVNAKARYDVTPLIFAATNGHLEVVAAARGARR